MRSLIRWGLLLSLLGWTAALAVAEPPELVQRALASNDAGDENRWAYTETIVRNGETKVGRHDPTLPEAERWALISIDGRRPTEAESTKYVERHAMRATRDEREADGLHRLIAPGSLELIDEDATHAVYAFKPVADDDNDAKLYAHLDATLRVAKHGPFVDRVELANSDAFSPGFGLKVKQFSLVMTFHREQEHGAVLPRTNNFRLLGRAMMVKKIDVSAEISYGDYRYSGNDSR